MNDPINNTNERKEHVVKISNRHNMEITGVKDVIAFDEVEVTLETVKGMMVVKGMDFRVKKLNLEAGNVHLEGEIDSIMYGDELEYEKSGNSIFSKLFKG